MWSVLKWLAAKRLNLGQYLRLVMGRRLVFQIETFTMGDSMVNAKRTKTGNYLILIQGGLSKTPQTETFCPGPQPACQPSHFDTLRATWLIMKRLVS